MKSYLADSRSETLGIVFPLTQFWFQDKMTAGRGGGRPKRARTLDTSNVNGTWKGCERGWCRSSPTSGCSVSFGKEGLVETCRSRDASFMNTAGPPPPLAQTPTLGFSGFLRLFPCLYIFLCFLLLLHYMLPRHQCPHQNFPTSCHTSLIALIF